MGIADEVRARRRGVRLSAQRLFTNRHAEKAVFEARLADVAGLRAREVDWAVDLQAPRRNVLTFYGYGGIGKSRLSRELEERFLQGAVEGQRRATVRIDFSEPSARDAELYLLALRAGVADLASSFPAFDTALALYWEREHPGTSMADFVRNQSVLGGLADREALAAHLSEVAQGLLDGAGIVVSGASRLVSLTWAKVREQRTVKKLERDCPYFEGCMAEEDLDELRLHLPLLLAWDLAQLAKRAHVDVVVFLDTFEHVSHGRRAARKGDIEDAIARSMFFLRGVTFVVTSRVRLDWASPRRRPSLEFSGSEDWPGLADLPDGHGDQHSVGVLSPHDCQEYLAACLVDEDGNSAIGAGLREGIAELSAGVPLYLDVAVNHYLGLVGGDRAPTLSDFARGIPEIVMRLVEDLDNDEADLLRSAALLGVFDRTTLQAAVPHIRASAVEHFLARSFVVDRGDQVYSVHEMLQASVRTQDSATANAWSAEEWRAAERRLVQFWTAQFEDSSATLWKDRRVQALAFWQLVGLYASTDVEADVLADVIMQVQLNGVWATIEAAREQPEELLTDRGRALLVMLDGMMARQVGHLEDADRLLSEALANPALTGCVARLAQYYLAETRDIYDGDPASLFAELAEQDDRIGTEARMAYAHSLTRAGDLAGALRVAESFDIAGFDDGEFRYRLHELLGVVWLFSGVFDRAVDHFEESRKVGESEKSPLLTALGLRHLALTQCWTEPSTVLAQIDEAERLNRDLKLQPGIGQCLVARAVALAGTAPTHVVDGLLAEADAVFTAAGYHDDALAAVAASVFTAAVAGDAQAAQDRKATLVRRAEGRRPRSWLAVADAWTDDDSHIDDIAWPQGRSEAVTTWRGALEARRVRP